MRSVVDFYLAGLADDFVSAAFSSFPGAALSRSLLCCRARVHLGRTDATPPSRATCPSATRAS